LLSGGNLKLNWDSLMPVGCVCPVRRVVGALLVVLLLTTISHGPWVLISAGIVRGRRLTSTVGIRDDVVNAGAEWVDAPSVIDGNIVSSRVPGDLPAFGKAMLEVLAKQK